MIIHAVCSRERFSLEQTAVEQYVALKSKRGVTFMHMNSNMKIVLHVPERSSRATWITLIYTLGDGLLAFHKSTHKASPTLFIRVSSGILCYICLCLRERPHMYTHTLVKFHFKQWFSLTHFLKDKWWMLMEQRQCALSRENHSNLIILDRDLELCIMSNYWITRTLCFSLSWGSHLPFYLIKQ